MKKERTHTHTHKVNTGLFSLPNTSTLFFYIENMNVEWSNKTPLYVFTATLQARELHVMKTCARIVSFLLDASDTSCLGRGLA